MSVEQRFLDTPENRVPFLIGAAAVIVGLAAAAWVSWTCDDAFISYRYARNLVEGSGLVYNPGERVEGYTNLLWTLWIAAGLALHVDPETWSSIFGLLSYGGVLMVILLAWSFQVEFTLSLWLSSLYQACLAVLGLCFLLRRFVN